MSVSVWDSRREAPFGNDRRIYPSVSWDGWSAPVQTSVLSRPLHHALDFTKAVCLTWTKQTGRIATQIRLMVAV